MKIDDDTSDGLLACCANCQDWRNVDADGFERVLPVAGHVAQRLQSRQVEAVGNQALKAHLVSIHLRNQPINGGSPISGGIRRGLPECKKDGQDQAGDEGEDEGTTEDGGGKAYATMPPNLDREFLDVFCRGRLVLVPLASVSDQQIQFFRQYGKRVGIFYRRPTLVRGYLLNYGIDRLGR